MVFSGLFAHHSRRSFLHALVLAALGPRLLEWSGAAEPEHPEVPNDAVRRIIDGIVKGRPFRRGHVQLDMPVVAEDGRVVPVIVESDLPMDRDRYVAAVHLVVDHNPDAHLAAFRLTPALGSAAISTRIKMKRTTWVRALVETSAGEVWAAYARVNVSLNGCG